MLPHRTGQLKTYKYIDVFSYILLAKWNSLFNQGYLSKIYFTGNLSSEVWFHKHECFDTKHRYLKLISFLSKAYLLNANIKQIRYFDGEKRHIVVKGWFVKQWICTSANFMRYIISKFLRKYKRFFPWFAVLFFSCGDQCKAIPADGRIYLK